MSPFDLIDISLIKLYKKIATVIYRATGINHFFLASLCLDVSIFLTYRFLQEVFFGYLIVIIMIIYYLSFALKDSFKKKQDKDPFLELLLILIRFYVCLFCFVSTKSLIQGLDNILLVSSIYLISLPSLPPNESLSWIKSLISRKLVRVPVKK